MNIMLVEPTIEYKQDALSYLNECIISDGMVHGSGGLSSFNSYKAWLKHLQLMKEEATVPEGLVPSSTYFAVSEGSRMILGMIDIRYRLNEYLAIRGGHIGYSIRPAYRGNGYGINMLQLALQKCRELGMSDVLITCDKNNIRSAKTALHCGGSEEFTNKSMEDGFRRFWIKLY